MPCLHKSETGNANMHIEHCTPTLWWSLRPSECWESSILVHPNPNHFEKAVHAALTGFEVCQGKLILMFHPNPGDCREFLEKISLAPRATPRSRKSHVNHHAVVQIHVHHVSDCLWWAGGNPNPNRTWVDPLLPSASIATPHNLETACQLWNSNTKLRLWKVKRVNFHSELMLESTSVRFTIKFSGNQFFSPKIHKFDEISTLEVQKSEFLERIGAWVDFRSNQHKILRKSTFWSKNPWDLTRHLDWTG